MKIEFDGDWNDIMADIVRMVNQMGFQIVPFGPPPEYDRQADAGVNEVPEEIRFAAGTDAPKDEPAPKKRGRPKKEAAVQEQEEPLPQAEEDKKQDPVALLKLKNDTLKRLRDLYVAGKGTFVRELLAKHGDGALVFPEVAAEHFPAIVADLERELN